MTLISADALHGFLVLLAWVAVGATLFFTGCAELDRRDDPVTDLGEEPIDADGWEWSVPA